MNSAFNNKQSGLLVPHLNLKTFFTWKWRLKKFWTEIQWVPKNMRLGRRLMGLLTDISERIKGHSIKPNMWKISVMQLKFYLAL